MMINYHCNGKEGGLIRLKEINKLIQEYYDNNTSMCIDRLGTISGIKFSHRNLKFSKGLFYCDCCKGYRHMVTGLKLSGALKVILSKSRAVTNEKEEAMEN